MSKRSNILDAIDHTISDGIRSGILHLSTQDVALEKNYVTLNGRRVVNFGSCSYLGLEFNQEMKEAAKLAVEAYGTQFSSSRAYVSAGFYESLEEKFGQIFENTAIVAPTTTLGHIATIPIVVSDADAVILDHQVHSSVQNAVGLLKSRGIHVEMIRHSRMDLLEERIIQLKQKHHKVWYMADGIYSMYGDAAPIADLHALMNQYPCFHCYLDDAHGMSCYGKHGRGSVLKKFELHDKMILATSLAKAFATGGAVLVFKDNEMARKVRTCGGPLITSGPMQPASLGAAIASARIHLSDRISAVQVDLHDKIRYTNLMLRHWQIPLVCESDSPIFYVGVGLPKVAYELISRMMDNGFYMNLGAFPAVPMKNTGVRFTITRLHTFEQIDAMIQALAYHLPMVLQETNHSLEKIYQAFSMPMCEEMLLNKYFGEAEKESKLTLTLEKSIHNLNKEEWDRLFLDEGTYDWDGLKMYEQVFSGNAEPENNWDFDYVVVRNSKGKPILATFLTTTIGKDDMLSPAEISQEIELHRAGGDAYYLCSKVLMMGSYFSEGRHLYLDKESPYWRDALTMLLTTIGELQDKYEVKTTILRDFTGATEEFDKLLVDNGFCKLQMPDSFTIENLRWQGLDAHIASLSKSKRIHWRRNILRYTNEFEVRFPETVSPDLLREYYQLYLNVKQKNFEINTFNLPFNLFCKMAVHPDWEVMELRLRENPRKPVLVSFQHKGSKSYTPMLIGIDYTASKMSSYRQAAAHMLERAGNQKYTKIKMGFGAPIEKENFGAKAQETFAYFQTSDMYNMHVLGNMAVVRTPKPMVV